MKNKAWAKPTIGVVEFMAGDYCVSSCRTNSTAIDYRFTCDALPPADDPAAGLNYYTYSWLFADNNSATDNGNRIFHYDATGSFEAVSKWNNDTDLQSSIGKYDYVSTYKSSYDQAFGVSNHFNSCNADHLAPSNDVFVSGWFVPGLTKTENEQEVFDDIYVDGKQEATIWISGKDAGLHATFTLIENLEYSKS